MDFFFLSFKVTIHYWKKSGQDPKQVQKQKLHKSDIFWLLTLNHVLLQPKTVCPAVNHSTIKIIHYKRNHGKIYLGNSFCFDRNTVFKNCNNIGAQPRQEQWSHPSTCKWRKGEISEVLTHWWRVTDTSWVLREGELVFLRSSSLDIVFSS